MNKDNAGQFLPLVQALHEGKQMQFDSGPYQMPDWNDCNKIDTRNHPSRYRIKPEPRRIWVNEYNEKGIIHNSKDEAINNATNDAKRIAVEYVEVIK